MLTKLEIGQDVKYFEHYMGDNIVPSCWVLTDAQVITCDGRTTAIFTKNQKILFKSRKYVYNLKDPYDNERLLKDEHEKN